MQYAQQSKGVKARMLALWFVGAAERIGVVGLRSLTCITACVWMFLVSGAVAAFELDPDVKKFELLELSYLVEDGPLTVEKLSGLPQDTWKTEVGTVNLGYTQKVHWFKFSVDTRQDQTRLLQVAYPLLDDVTFYHFNKNDLMVSYEVGDKLPFSHRPVENRYFLFPLTFEANSQNTIFLRVQTSGSLRMPIFLWDQQSFYEQDSKDVALEGLYFGMLIIMAAFNLLLYFSLREKTYLYYVFFVASIVLLMASLYGFGFQFVYPNFPGFHGAMILLAVPATQIAVCLFTINFFKFNETSRFWFRLFAVLVALNVFCFFGGFIFSYGVSTRLSVLVTLPVSVAAAIAGLRFWHSGGAGAQWFSLAWLFFLLTSIALALSRMGLIPASLIMEQSLPISTISQALFFALALAARFNSERDARLKAQQEHLFELSKRREAEKQLVYAAGHNEITLLPNRLFFEKAILPYTQLPPSGRSCVAIVLLHVRRFDDVNKTLGHRNADALLRKIGERIDAVVGQWPDALPLEEINGTEVYTAHIEGVSFCFALATQSRETIVRDIEELIRLIATPMEFLDLALELSFIAGCSFSGPESSSEDQSDPQTLLRQAFIAFDAASKNLSPIAVYEHQMNPYSAKRLTLMTELRAALGAGDLALFYQPQVKLRTGEVFGFEALLRWNHREYGFVPPDEFIPMAEKTGLMKLLTAWVLERAIIFIKQLARFDQTLKVSVNISALNLREIGFCRDISSLLQKHEVHPSLLSLEVTETAAMIDPDHAVSALGLLYDAGVRLSIDDFGTGHSSLAYIRKLPVHEIKIDRSFVREMHINKNDATIVRTTVNMCHDLGYEVVAEGVENLTIQNVLTTIGCDIVQGYYIARPMDEAATLAWIDERVKTDMSKES